MKRLGLGLYRKRIRSRILRNRRTRRIVGTKYAKSIDQTMTIARCFATAVGSNNYGAGSVFDANTVVPFRRSRYLLRSGRASKIYLKSPKSSVVFVGSWNVQRVLYRVFKTNGYSVSKWYAKIANIKIQIILHRQQSFDYFGPTLFSQLGVFSSFRTRLLRN